jgi:hypothetical protein
MQVKCEREVFLQGIGPTTCGATIPRDRCPFFLGSYSKVAGKCSYQKEFTWPLTIQRFIEKNHLRIEWFAPVINMDAYELTLESGDVIMVSGPTLIKYEEGNNVT